MKHPEHILRNPFYSFLWNEVYDKDLNVVIAVCGRPGTAKSGSALRMCFDLDVTRYGVPRFSIERAVYTVQDFLYHIRQKYPVGTAILWDEIGVEGDARDWYTLKNKLLKRVVETYRYKNYITFVTVPSLNSIDKGVRGILTGYIEMRGKYGDGNQAIGKFEITDVNPKTGKIYFKKLRYWDKELGCWSKMHQIVIPKPPEQLWEAYEQKKEETLKNWYSLFAKQLEVLRQETTVPSEDGDEFDVLKEKVLKEPMKFFDEHRNRFSAILIKAGLKIPMYKAREISQLLNLEYKKGLINIGKNGQSG